jgi:hypothetical protein
MKHNEFDMSSMVWYPENCKYVDIIRKSDNLLMQTFGKHVQILDDDIPGINKDDILIKDDLYFKYEESCDPMTNSCYKYKSEEGFVSKLGNLIPVITYNYAAEVFPPLLESIDTNIDGKTETYKIIYHY